MNPPFPFITEAGDDFHFYSYLFTSYLSTSYLLLLTLQSYHRTTFAADTSPAPNVTNTTLSPRLIFFFLTASYKATAIDAADMLPYLSMLIKNFSLGRWSLRATAEMIRSLAW